MATRAGAQYPGADAVVEVNIGSVLYDWNDLAAALEHVERGLRSIYSWGKADLLALAYVTLCRIQHAIGDRNAAVDTVHKAVELTQTHGVFPEAYGAVEAAQVKLWLAQKDLPSALRWAASVEERTFGSDDPFRFKDELAQITRARVFMAQNRLDDAMGLLSHLEATAQSCGRIGRLIEILILKALAMQKLGEPAQALAVLTESLALAEPEGYIRVFVDEGSRMQALLAQWLAHGSSGPLRDYAIHLLSNLDAEPQVITAVQKRASPTGDLVEPLSERELEVLHLIATGKTNKQIAQQLIVALGTVKAHTASIFRKLDVANRTEAVAQARLLGILP
jgi:LuxR family maltose regulon positive regulatory protein